MSETSRLPYQVLIDTAYHRAGDVVNLWPDQVIPGRHIPLVTPEDATISVSDLAAKADSNETKISVLEAEFSEISAAVKSTTAVDALKSEIEKLWARLVALENAKPSADH
jgi:hypothetical protein